MGTLQGRMRAGCGALLGVVVVLVGSVGRGEQRPADEVARVSFTQDVIPVLTKAGCNSGGCHGKLAGQNGFKLSLRGYAPEWDYEWLRTDLSGRRINPGRPDESLILLKALGKVPHEGGKRFEEGSAYHRVLRDWVAQRAPGIDPKDQDAERIEVRPGDRVMAVGEEVQLSVVAHYGDGRVRDVTWLTQFYSNDETTVAVSGGGKLRALRAGETAVRAHFQGQVEVVMVSTPYGRSDGAGAYVKKNNVVDEHVFAKLEALGIPPSEGCDDATFLRRASVDLTGAIPTPEEVRAFVADRDDGKRAKLVEKLLASPEFVDYWTLQWSDLFQNRKERDHDVRGAKGVRAFQAWLRGQVEKNRPWDELAREVLTAKGDTTSRPEVGYYVVTVGEKSKAEESEAAESVAQAFLGTRIGCAKCHNHPLEKFTQDDYYHFTAYFAKVSMKRQSPEKGATELVVAGREEKEALKQVEEAEKKLAEGVKAAEGKSGEEEKARKKVEEYEKRLAETKKKLEEVRGKLPEVEQPRTKKKLAARPLDRAEVKVAAGQDPREALAGWVTDARNEAFAGAMVNRLWRHFMGVGLVEPVDDLRSSNPPSNPGLWKALKGEFVAGGYDLKQLMRVIVNSRAYQLSSATLPGNEKDRKFYSHYYAKRLPAEVMLDAISAATGVPDTFAGHPVGVRAVQLPEPAVSSYFLTLFGRSERVTACACERSGEVTLPQLLHLQNGEDLAKKIRDGEGRLAKAMKDGRDVVEEAFLATVGRWPTERERAVVKEQIGSAGVKEEVYRDLFWALLNSKEFAFNH